MSSESVRDLERIMVLDDKSQTRETLAIPIEFANRTAVKVSGRLGTLERFLANAPSADAAIADYQLTPGHYADFDGDELVAAWYKQGFPAILCTSFATSNAAQFRRLRRWIPVVMSPQDLEPDSLMRALELTRREINEDFVPPRRPWRALVRFVEFDEAANVANAKVAGWGEDVVGFSASGLPDGLRDHLRVAFKGGDEYRCFATANLGAESSNDLYVTEWEV